MSNEPGAGKRPLKHETGSLDAMKGRTDKESTDPVRDMPADEASRPGEHKSRHEEKHGGSQERSMMEQVLAPANLLAAWKQVRANRGAPGIDGRTVEAFPAFCREHWPRICAALIDGTYHPAAVRRVFIPKPDGTERPLGVPTILDRVIQQALAQVWVRSSRADSASIVMASAKDAMPIRRCASWRLAGRKAAGMRWIATSKPSSTR